VSHIHRPSPDPRRAGCACGHHPLVDTPVAVQADADKAGNYEEYVDRDLALERYLSGLAARAAGYLRAMPDGSVQGDTGGLDEFADARAWSGGVRASIDARREIQEELADARHYAVWGIQQIWDAYRAGDSAAAREYDRYMRALQHIVEAWHALAGSTRASG
jgi:hypothetical protein